MLALAQHFAVYLAGGGLGQFAHDRDVPGIFVLAQPGPDQVLYFLGEIVATWTFADDERLDHLAAQLVHDANRGGLANVGVRKNGILDLDRAHGPARGDDYVVRAPGVVEVAVLIDAREVAGRYPLVTAIHHQVSGDAWSAGCSGFVLHLDLHARGRLAQ